MVYGYVVTYDYTVEHGNEQYVGISKGIARTLGTRTPMWLAYKISVHLVQDSPQYTTAHTQPNVSLTEVHPRRQRGAGAAWNGAKIVQRTI